MMLGRAVHRTQSMASLAAPRCHLVAAGGPGRAKIGADVQLPTVVVVALLATAGLPVLSATMLAVALPDVAEDLAASAPAVSLVVGTFVTVQLCAQPFIGAFVDRLGFQRSLHCGMALLTLGSLQAMVSPTLSGLLYARAVQALGVAIVLPTIHARLVADRGHSGRRFGLLTSVGNVMAAVGPLLGGLLVARLGWRGVFATTGVMTATASVLLLVVHRRVPSANRSGHASLVVGLRPHRLLADGRVAAAACLNAMDAVVLTMLLVGMPFVAGDQDTISPATALTTLTVAGAIVAPVGGWLADRAGYAIAARTGFLTAAGGLLALPASSPLVGPAGTYAALTVIGVGLGLEFPAVQASPIAHVSAPFRATASCLAATSRHLGSLVGALCIASVVLLHPAAVTQVAAGAALVGAWLASSVDDHPPGDRAER
jgi:MFS family permease